MNDLAEKALHGIDAARRGVCARPLATLGVLGFAVACLVVAAGGEVGAARSTHPLSTWIGLQDGHAEAGDPLPGTALLAGIALLVVLWIVTVEVVRRTRPLQRQVWWVAAAWATPFAVGPPLMDTAVYGYAAFGMIQRHGGNPYDHGPAVLGDRAVVAAVDPGLRNTPSSAGPLGTLLQHLSVSVSGGSALGAVIVLRVVGVLTAVAIGRLAADLAARRRARAVSLTVLNPLVLLYVVSAAHLDGVLVAFVLAALVAATRRRWTRAIVLAAVAGSVSAQGLVVLPTIFAVHWFGRSTTVSRRPVMRDLVAAGATVGVLGLVVPHGFDWTRTVSKQFAAHPPFSVASAVAKVLTPVVRGAPYDDLAAGARITTVTAMVCTIVYLLVTVRHRPLERTAGYSLLAMALLAPVLYPWYLLWGVLCLAPTAYGERRIAVLALSAGACLLVPPGFAATTTNIITAGTLIAVAAVTGAVLIRSQPRQPVSAAG
jgi:hypothetical protein